MKRIVSEPKPGYTDNVNDEAHPISPMHFKELKAHPKLYDSRKRAKGLIHIADFAQKVKSDLESFSIAEGHYDHDLVLKMCDVAEFFFMDKGCGDVKKEAVISVLLPYFNNDRELVSKIIEFVFPMVTKSTLFRRNKKRLWNGFVVVVNFFFGNPLIMQKYKV